MPPEKPIFADPESQKAAQTCARVKKEVRPTENDPLKVLPIIEQMIVEERKRWQTLRDEGLDRRSLSQEILGSEERAVSPSLVSKCLRWWGYQKLGHPPLSKNFNSILRLESGIALHRALEKLLSPMGVTEHRLIRREIDGVEMTGVIDILFRSPKSFSEIGDWQVIEIKTVSTNAFQKQLNRKNLRPDLIPTKGIITPRESDKKQVSLYLRLLEEEGLKLIGANIIYVNRDTCELKEALIPWDAITQYETSEFIEEIRKAQELIAEGKLPEGTPDSKVPCTYYCDYRHICLTGRPKAAKRKKPMPGWVRQRAKEQEEERKRIMEEAGMVQPLLGGDFEELFHK